jgi:hypothetical protein
MLDKDKIKEQLTPIDVWVTPNIATYRQQTLWTETTKEFHFVPCTVMGYVILTAYRSLMGCKVFRAFCLYRPAGAKLVWYCDKPLNFRVLSVADARLWEEDSKDEWVDVFGYHGNTGNTR